MNKKIIPVILTISLVFACVIGSLFLGYTKVIKPTLEETYYDGKTPLENLKILINQNPKLKGDFEISKYDPNKKTFYSKRDIIFFQDPRKISGEDYPYELLFHHDLELSKPAIEEAWQSTNYSKKVLSQNGKILYLTISTPEYYASYSKNSKYENSKVNVTKFESKKLNSPNGLDVETRVEILLSKPFEGEKDYSGINVVKFEKAPKSSDYNFIIKTSGSNYISTYSSSVDKDNTVTLDKLEVFTKDGSKLFEDKVIESKLIDFDLKSYSYDNLGLEIDQRVEE